MQRANSVRNLYTNPSSNSAPQGGGAFLGNRAHSSRQAQQQHRAQQTAKLRGPLYSNVTNGSVVIDIGTRTVKVGIVGDVAPTLIIKTPARLSQLLLLGSSIQRAGGVLSSPQQQETLLTTTDEAKEALLMREKGGRSGCVAVVLPTEVEQLISTTSAATISALALAGKGSLSALSSAAQNEVRSTESLRLIAAGGTEVLFGIGGQNEGEGVVKRCNGDESSNIMSVTVSTDSGGMYEEEVSALMAMISARVPLIGSTKTPIFLQDVDCNPQLAAAVKVWLGTRTDPLGKMAAAISYPSFIENAHNYQPDLSLTTTATMSPTREDEEGGTSTNPSPMALSRVASLRRIGIVSANRSVGGGGGANSEDAAAATSNSNTCTNNPNTTFNGDCAAAAAGPTTTTNTMMRNFSLQAISHTNLANSTNTDTFGTGTARVLPIPTAPIDGVAYFSGNINPVVGARGGNNQHSGNNPRSKFSINNYISMKHGLGLGGGKGVALADLSAEVDEDAQGLKDLHQMSGREVSGLDMTTYYSSSAFGKQQPQATRTVSSSSPTTALNSVIDDSPLGGSGANTSGGGKAAYKDPHHRVDRLGDIISSPNSHPAILDANAATVNAPPLPKSQTDNTILIDVRKELETCLSLVQHSGGTASSSLSAGVGVGSGGGGGLGTFKSSSNLRAALVGVNSGGLLGDGGTTTSYEERARAMSEFSPITVAAASGSPQQTYTQTQTSPNFGNMLTSQQNQNAASAGVAAAAAAAQTSSLAPITPSQKRALVQNPSPSTTVSHYYAHDIEKTQTSSSPTTSSGFEKTKSGEETSTAAVNCAPATSQQLSLSPTIHSNPVISHNIFSKPANSVLTLSLQASALAAYGLRSGLVLDLGWKSSRVVPIIHNVCDKRLAATPCFWGMRNVINILRRQIMEENFSSNSNNSSGRLLAQSEALLTDDLLHDFILQYGVVAPPVGHPKRDAILEAKYPIVLKTNVVYGKPNHALEVLFTGCVVLPPPSNTSSHTSDGPSSSPSRSVSVFGSPLRQQQQTSSAATAAVSASTSNTVAASNSNEDNNNNDALYRLAIGSAASEVIQSLQKMSASASPPATTSGVVDPLATASSATPYTTFLDTLITSGLRRSGDEVSAGPRAHLLLLQHLEKVKKHNVVASERQNEEGKEEERGNKITSATSTLSETPTFRGGIVLHIFEALLRCHPWFNLAEAGSVLVLTGCMASIPNLYKRLASVLAELSGKYMLRREHLESELIAPYANNLGAKLAMDFNVKNGGESQHQHVAKEEKQKQEEEKERFMKQYPLPAVSKLDYISVFAKAEVCDDVLSHAMSTMMTSNADGGEGGSHPANLGGSDAASGAGYAYKLALEHLYVESVRKQYSSSSSSFSIAGAGAAVAAAAVEREYKNICEAIKNMRSHDIVREISVASASAALHRMANANIGGMEPTISPFGLKMVLAVAETRIRDVLKSMKVIPPSITPQQMPTAAAERNGAASSSSTTTATRRPPSSTTTTAVSCLITSKEYPFLAGGRLLPSAAAVVGVMAVYGTN